MRRLVIPVLLALVVAACGRAPYESADYTKAAVDAGVVLWRLADGPAGIVGAGGPVTAADLEEGGGPFTLVSYRSPDGTEWEAGGTLGTAESPSFALTSWPGGYAAAAVWDGSPAVLRSEDGLEWERTPLPSTGDAEVEPAGIAAASDGTLLVTGSSGGDPMVWVVEGGTVETVDGSGFGSVARFPQAASGPAGFVVSAVGAGEGGPPPPVWVSADGRTWEPVPDPFGGLTGITGLIGASGGYVAVVAVPGEDDAYRLWTSADGTGWVQRADQESVFAHLEGVTGDLYADLLAPPAEEGVNRPIAFAFDGTWLEIVEAFEGRRYLTVAVAVREGTRILSGFTGRDEPEPLVLRAGARAAAAPWESRP